MFNDFFLVFFAFRKLFQTIYVVTIANLVSIFWSDDIRGTYEAKRLACVHYESQHGESLWPSPPGVLESKSKLLPPIWQVKDEDLFLSFPDIFSIFQNVNRFTATLQPDQN